MCMWAKWFDLQGVSKKVGLVEKKTGSKKSICTFAQIKKLMMSLSLTLVRRSILG